MKPTAINTRGNKCVKGIVYYLFISVPTYEISCMRLIMEFSTMQSLALRK